MLLDKLDRRVHPGDAMINREIPEGYFALGRAALECIQECIGDQRPASILDLPCGHGRVLRFLRAAYPDASITACDIDREGVDFCAQLGATPLYSSEDPSDIDTGKFDLIWCGSLLTHFDAPQWRDWLDFFQSHLEPGGSLVLTTHGRAYAREDAPIDMPPEGPELLTRYRQTGFAFHAGWHLSFSSPAWVFDQIDHRPVTTRFVEQGWHGLQDVWCLTMPE